MVGNRTTKEIILDIMGVLCIHYDPSMTKEDCIQAIQDSFMDDYIGRENFKKDEIAFLEVVGVQFDD